MRKEIPPKSTRLRGHGYGLTDLLVISACCAVFAAVMGAGKSMEPKGPPTALIARDSGTTAQAPSKDDHKSLVATALDIFAERLNTVVE